MELAIFSLLTLTTNIVDSKASNQSSDSANLRVGTSTGIRRAHRTQLECPKTRQWRAIPFTEPPPVASCLWLPPQKLLSSPSEHHYMTKLPPSCPQFVAAVESMSNLPLTKGNLVCNGGYNDSFVLVDEATYEECLYLAVWTLSEPPPKREFTVFIFSQEGAFPLTASIFPGRP